MSFLIVMTIGLAGLFLMALPGLQRQSHVGTTPRSAHVAQGGLRLGHGPRGHAGGSANAHVGHAAASPGPRAPNPAAHATSAVAGGKAGAQTRQNVDGLRAFRFVPSPRAIFSVMTMFGAFGYALVAGLQLGPVPAGLLALIPACGIEYVAVRPLWNLMFQFQGQPCSSLGTLLFCEAKAVTPFRNGRGLVSVEHDGRIVQLSARLDRIAGEHAGSRGRSAACRGSGCRRPARRRKRVLRSICFNNCFIEELVMYLVYIGLAMLAVFALLPLIVNAFLRDVEAGEIRLVSWMGGKLKIYRGPCKSTLIPMLTVSKVIPAQAINIDIEITDQTADLDAGGRPAPVKVTVKASAIVSVGETDGMVNTAANKFFSKPKDQQLSTLTDVLSSAGRRAINLLKHDQLFNARSGGRGSQCGDRRPG